MTRSQADFIDAIFDALEDHIVRLRDHYADVVEQAGAPHIDRPTIDAGDDRPVIQQPLPSSKVGTMTLDQYRQLSDDAHRHRIAAEYGGALMSRPTKRRATYSDPTASEVITKMESSARRWLDDVRNLARQAQVLDAQVDDIIGLPVCHRCRKEIDREQRTRLDSVTTRREHERCSPFARQLPDISQAA